MSRLKITLWPNMTGHFAIEHFEFDLKTEGIHNLGPYKQINTLNGKELSICTLMYRLCQKKTGSSDMLTFVESFHKVQISFLYLTFKPTCT